ncbi:MAG: hypothetical protein WKF75_14190 [Singulisphaera sp.]
MAAETNALEAFLRDYADVVGGLWDEVEPQVFDLMLPPPAGPGGGGGGEPEVVRVAFDPEALPEHPGAQLASFGTPMVDRLLADAMQCGRRAELYLVGLNLAPQNLAGRAGRSLTLSSGLELRVGRVRPLHSPQAVFWFEATFVSDQKEQELLPVAVDLHQGRQVRHLERLLDHSHLGESPWSPLPEARHGGLASAYPLARGRVVRTVAALANVRVRELGERLDRQVARMTRYYADLRAEMEEQAERARTRDEDAAQAAARREGVDREERLRVAELRQKGTLRVHLRLTNLLVVHQPKLSLRATLEVPGSSPTSLELVWDPLIEGLEAPACPACGQPTFAFELAPRGRLACPSCVASPPSQAKPTRR